MLGLTDASGIMQVMNVMITPVDHLDLDRIVTGEAVLIDDALDATDETGGHAGPGGLENAGDLE